MRKLLALLAILLIAGCGGGGSPTTNSGNPNNPDAPADAGQVRLALDSQQDGNEWRVNLYARSARDLYQIAGSMQFDSSRYEVVAVEAGGGLGTPADSLFVGQETAPGNVDFAYTRRYHGPGVDGEAWLLSLRVRPHGNFSLADFTLDRSEERLLLRDSQRRHLQAAGEVR